MMAAPIPYGGPGPGFMPLGAAMAKKSLELAQCSAKLKDLFTTEGASLCSGLVFSKRADAGEVGADSRDGGAAAVG